MGEKRGLTILEAIGVFAVLYVIWHALGLPEHVSMSTAIYWIAVAALGVVGFALALALLLWGGMAVAFVCVGFLWCVSVPFQAFDRLLEKRLSAEEYASWRRWLRAGSKSA